MLNPLTQLTVFYFTINTSSTLPGLRLSLMKWRQLRMRSWAKSGPFELQDPSASPESLGLASLVSVLYHPEEGYISTRLKYFKPSI